MTTEGIPEGGRREPTRGIEKLNRAQMVALIERRMANLAQRIKELNADIRDECERRCPFPQTQRCADCIQGESVVRLNTTEGMVLLDGRVIPLPPL